MDSGIWSMVEICIGIVSASVPTVRPIYNIIVRGHHCPAYGNQCSRCERSRGSNELRMQRSPVHWSGSKLAIIRKRACKPSIESADLVAIPGEKVGKPSIASSDLENGWSKEELIAKDSSLSEKDSRKGEITVEIL